MTLGPIFIGGLAFSGKTQLRLMLSSHPNIAMSRRTYMWTRFYNRYGDLSHPDNFEWCLTDMLQQKHMQVLEPDPVRIRREFWQGPPTYARLFALFQEHYAERLGKSRWGDQLGFVERYADLILAAYPSARMIHMIRDPRSRYQVARTRSRQRTGKVGWEIARWRYSVSLALQNQAQYSDRYKVVRYETLVAQPKETMRGICVFIEEDFVPSMIEMENAIRFDHKSGNRTASGPGLNINTEDSNASLCRVMSRREIAFIQTSAGRDMLAFDYALEPIRFSFRERLLFFSVDWPANRLGMSAWYSLNARQATKS